MAKTRTIEKQVELPIEVGKTYKTKMQTGELFHVTKIQYKMNNPALPVNQFFGIYESYKHLGECPIGGERLYPEFTTVLEEIPVCECCGQDLKTQHNHSKE